MLMKKALWLLLLFLCLGQIAMAQTTENQTTTGNKKKKELPTINHTQLDVKPVYLTNEKKDSATPGMAFKASVSWPFSQGKLFGKSTYWRLNAAAKGTIAGDPALNPNPLTGEFNFGWHILLRKPPRIIFGPGEIPGKQTSRSIPAVDYGTFGVGASGSYETDQLGDNSNLLFSLKLSFIKDVEWIRVRLKKEDQGAKTEESGKGWPLPMFLAPSVIVTYDLARATESEARQNLGLPDSSYQRMRFLFAWKWKFGELFAGKKGLEWATGFCLFADLRHVMEFNTEEAWDRAGLDESTYFAGTLAYQLENDIISRVFFRVSTGRIPPETENTTTFFLGVEVPLGKVTGISL